MIDPSLHQIIQHRIAEHRHENVWRRAYALGMCMAWLSTCSGQLAITEIMFDSRSPEPQWEWIELQNRSDEDVNLDQFVLDDLSNANALTGPNIAVKEDASGVINTVVPAEGVAVVYNAGATGFSGDRFRHAWQLDHSVTLVGVDGFPSLNNTGDAFGLWESLDSYNRDLANTDEDVDLEVASFDYAIAWIDFREGFPSAAGRSIAWTGTGDYRDGGDWRVSDAESGRTSRETFLPDSPINSSNDVGTPGEVNGENLFGLVVTEIMYNPASNEPLWEWVEIYNGNDASLDFSVTPYYLDDASGSPLSVPNVTVGSIEAGETALLYHSGLPLEDLQSAWGNKTNYIPVDRWPGLNNSGDSVALWGSAEGYERDNADAERRTFVESVVAVTYLDGAEDWPNVRDGQSLRLVAAGADAPGNWIASSLEDGEAWGATTVISSLPDHLGGDIGTPGTLFGEPISGPGNNVEVSADFDGDGVLTVGDATILCSGLLGKSDLRFDLTGDGEISGADFARFLNLAQSTPGDLDVNGVVEFADFLRLSAHFGSAGSYADGDTDCNGMVDFADFLTVSANFGVSTRDASAVPEPRHSLLWIAFAILGVMRWPLRRCLPD